MKELEVEQLNFGGQARQAKNKARKAGRQRRRKGQTWSELAQILEGKNPVGT